MNYNVKPIEVVQSKFLADTEEGILQWKLEGKNIIFIWNLASYIHSIHISPNFVVVVQVSLVHWDEAVLLRKFKL